VPGSIGAWMTWRRWAAAAVLAAVALGSGVLWWRGRPERHLARVEEALRSGDPAAALEWLAVPEAAAGTRERALLLRARAAVERGQPLQAARALDKVDPHGPVAADFAFWKGRTLYAARQPLLAMDWFKAALKLRPDDAEADRWLACAAYDLGDRPTAVSALEAVTRLQPRDARAWRTLGLIFKEDAEHERARRAFEAALALDRDQPTVRLELAETLLRLGDATGAERELAACRGRVAEAPRAELLGECLRMRGDRAGHRAAVEAGLAAAPDHPGLLAQRAQIELDDGHPADALAWLDRAVAADPYRPETIYRRGLVLRQLGRAEEARRDLDRSAELNRGLAEMSDLNRQADRDPRDAEVRYRLGRLCTELGKPDLAASWYRAALACDPRHAAARLGLNALRAPRRAGSSRP
jgi:tetratricopeptide (TPR) repeat protein